MKIRDHQLDNLKSLLLFLVIFVHVLSLYKRVYGDAVHYTAAMYLMACICAFHMPLFMMISGYFSKNLKRSLPVAGRLLRIYLFVQAYFMLWYLCARGADFSLRSLLTPRFSMWYLFALILMHLLLPVFVKRPGIWIPVLTAANIVLNVFAPDDKFYKSLLKCACFFIFFIIGYYLRKEQISWLGTHKKLCGILLLLCFGSLGLVSLLFDIPLHMLRLLSLHEESVLWLGIGGAGFLVCAYLLLLALVISFCILGLTPRRKCIFSTLGKNSLSVYLLQAYYIVIMTFILEKLPLISPREPLTAAIISAAGGLLLFGCTPVSRAVSCLTGSHLPLLAQKMKGNRHVRN